MDKNTRFRLAIRQMYILMLYHTVQFPSKVHFVSPILLTSNIYSFFSAGWWYKSGFVQRFSFALNSREQWSSLIVKCTYAADTAKHLLTAGHNSFPKHSCTLANKTHSVFHLSEWSSVCFQTFIFLTFFPSKLIISMQDKVQLWTIKGQFDKRGKS